MVKATEAKQNQFQFQPDFALDEGMSASILEDKTTMWIILMMAIRVIIHETLNEYFPTNRELMKAKIAAKDYYAVLGLNYDASTEDVKRSYRKLALQYHPDRQTNIKLEEKLQKELKMKEINKAYESIIKNENNNSIELNDSNSNNNQEIKCNMEFINKPNMLEAIQKYLNLSLSADNASNSNKAENSNNVTHKLMSEEEFKKKKTYEKKILKEEINRREKNVQEYSKKSNQDNWLDDIQIKRNHVSSFGHTKGKSSKNAVNVSHSSNIASSEVVSENTDTSKSSACTADVSRRNFNMDLCLDKVVVIISKDLQCLFVEYIESSMTAIKEVGSITKV
jgi:curved DNA-binding protein CbpA